ncbi:hypothetical protein [Sporosarcina sp. ACRSL]|uniref:hypothetical protein n=1 Tax=Sporosarcina sp. ACRSL TaxID=2918215 RepID=UPI001EF5320E|nr:hypothetical protein [Sporosarcina sp. ACRSL]
MTIQGFAFMRYGYGMRVYGGLWVDFAVYAVLRFLHWYAGSRDNPASLWRDSPKEKPPGGGGFL